MPRPDECWNRKPDGLDLRSVTREFDELIHNPPTAEADNEMILNTSPDSEVDRWLAEVPIDPLLDSHGPNQSVYDASKSDECDLGAYTLKWQDEACGANLPPAGCIGIAAKRDANNRHFRTLVATLALCLFAAITLTVWCCTQQAPRQVHRGTSTTAAPAHVPEIPQQIPAHSASDQGEPSSAEPGTANPSERSGSTPASNGLGNSNHVHKRFSIPAPLAPLAHPIADSREQKVPSLDPPEPLDLHSQPTLPAALDSIIPIPSAVSSPVAQPKGSMKRVLRSLRGLVHRHKAGKPATDDQDGGHQ